MQKKDTLFSIATEDELASLVFPLRKWDRIAFYGDLGSGKTTFIRALLRHQLDDASLIVRSPTYTYYQTFFDKKNGVRIHHADLYRLEKKEDFFYIGWDDILSDDESIVLIEWPEVLGDAFTPTKTVTITRTGETAREVRVT